MLVLGVKEIYKIWHILQKYIVILIEYDKDRNNVEHRFHWENAEGELLSQTEQRQDSCFRPFRAFQSSDAGVLTSWSTTSVATKKPQLLLLDSAFSPSLFFPVSLEERVSVQGCSVLCSLSLLSSLSPYPITDSLSKYSRPLTVTGSRSKVIGKKFQKAKFAFACTCNCCLAFILNCVF